MNLTNELIAKLIFASSQLRYFEMELEMEPNNLQLKDIVIKWQAKLDQVLLDMGLKEFLPLKTLIEVINL